MTTSATVYDLQAAENYMVVKVGLDPPSSNWIDILCPFCGQVVRAYLWSLSGGGKLCECGAKHTAYGKTIPRKAK